MDNFFSALPRQKKFESIFNPSFYQNVPESWTLYQTDVRGSTQAIESGLYRSVNMVGAASIAIASNVLNTSEFPFQFGGDGTTFFVPSKVEKELDAQLAGLADLSEREFKLPLRVAKIRVAQLTQKGYRLQVLKLALDSENFLTMFHGDGFSAAEKWMKEQGGYSIPTSPQAPPNLSGLSCRWEPILSENGEMVTFLIQSKNDSIAEVAACYQALCRLLGKPLEDFSPIKLKNLNMKWGTRSQKSESILKGYFRTLLGSLATKAFFAFGIKTPSFNPSQYLQSLPVKSDFKKFDGTLRMVLDLPKEKIEQVRQFLESEKQAGRAYYGMHFSSTALMTCLVFSLKQNNHLHFIDGNDGGYALAAKGLKTQRKEAAPVFSKSA